MEVFWVSYWRRWLLGGTISFTFTWFMGALEDHHCESTLFQFIFGLAAMKSRVWKGCFLITVIVIQITWWSTSSYPLFSQVSTTPNVMMIACHNFLLMYSVMTLVSVKLHRYALLYCRVVWIQERKLQNVQFSIRNYEVSTAMIIIPKQISKQCQYPATISPRRWIILQLEYLSTSQLSKPLGKLSTLLFKEIQLNMCRI